MDAQKLKAKRALRRQRRVRKGIRGTAAKPRLSVFRSNFHIYAQLIDDDAQVTLAAASTGTKGAKAEKGGNMAAARLVGQAIAAQAKTKGITEAAFDRGHYRFHGRVKALARAATEAGLKCTGLEEAAPKAGKPVPVEAKKEGGKKEAKKEGGKKTAEAAT